MSFSTIVVLLAAVLANCQGPVRAQSPGENAAGSQRMVMSRLPPVESRPQRRRKLMVGVPFATVDDDGQLTVQPNVAVAGQSGSMATSPAISMAAAPARWPIPHSLTQAADIVLPEDQVPILQQIWHRLSPGQSYVLEESRSAPWRRSSAFPSVQPPPEELPPGMERFFLEEMPGEGFFVDGNMPPDAVAEPVFQHDVGHQCSLWICPRCGPLGKLIGRVRSKLGGSGIEDAGIGQERVIWAISEIDTTQPLNNFRIRVDSAFNLERPDRAEYFWSKPGLPKGPPLPESSVDYQEIRFLMEVGGDKFSTLTELPLRIVDPERNNNTAGLGDLNVATKLVMLDGKRWQITQITRTYFNTSVSRRGLGAGHFSLEPGLLFRFKVNDRTYVHHEIKFWFPLGGDLDHAGEILRLGIGVSHVWYETDTFAILPTLELVGWSVLDGLETPPFGPPVEIDPEGIFNIHPGVRFVADTGGDLGLFELGLSGSFSASSNRWYQSLLRIEARWSY